LPAEWLVRETSDGVYVVEERMVYGPFLSLIALEVFLADRRGVAFGFK
jgi:hypothetical protein